MKNTFVSMFVRVTGMAVVLIILSAFSLAQDFTVHMKDQDGKTATHYISRNAVRDVSSSPVATDVIYRLDKGTIIKLNNQAKTYTEMTVAEARAQADKKAASMNPMQQQMMAHMAGSALVVNKLGAGETIAGYPTEKYSVKAGMMQMESWVTPSFELPAGYFDMVTASVGSQVGGAGQLMKAIKSGQIKGYLLKSSATSSMMQGVTVTSVATSVDKGAIPPSTFEPPAGYKKETVN